MRDVWPRIVFLVFVAGAAACSPLRYLHYPTAPEAGAPPLARVFLVGDAGILAFKEAEVPATTEAAAQKVERRQPATPTPLPWARPKDGEKKLFKDIVDEAIAMAVQSARQSVLLESLKNDVANRDTLARDAHQPLILWLGDNVYDTGVPRYPGDEGYKNGELTTLGLDYVQGAATIVVQAQVAVEAKADAIFVPGNHDWNQARTRGIEGRERVIEQGRVLERYVAERRASGALPRGVEIRMLPKNGCPGPDVAKVPIGTHGYVHVAAVDTEWLLQKEPDAGCVEGGNCQPCEPSTAEGTYDALRKIARDVRESDAVIVAAHHPLASYGIHGGHIYWTPLSWPRWLPLSPEDLAHGRNKAMVRGLRSAYVPETREPLLYAAGHEHNLQLLRLDPKGPFVAISGSASKISPVRPGRKALFTARQHGYMYMDFFADGRVNLIVVEVAADGKVMRHPAFELRAALKKDPPPAAR
jgi:hypothetical protein